MADVTTEASHDRLPRSQPVAYGAPTSEGVGETLQRDRSISEADLRLRLSEGARIVRAVVVEAGTTGDYVAYLRLSCRPGYSVLVLRRYEGPRAWSDFRTLRRAIGGYGYSGPVSVYSEGHPRLACLGIGTPD